MIQSQRHLFNIPDNVAYLNTAYMSPLLNSVVSAIDEGARLKSQPWRLTIPDFYDQVDQARSLFARIVNVNSKNIAILTPVTKFIKDFSYTHLKLPTNREV